MNILQTIIRLFGEGQFLPQNSVMKFLSKYLCYSAMLEEEICASSLFVIVGFDRAQFNYVSVQGCISLRGESVPPMFGF